MAKLKQRKDVDPEQFESRDSIKPGMILYGYCEGRFGRDSYGEKKVLEVHEDHVVVMEDGHVLTSFTINDWTSLVESSNGALEEERYQNREEDDVDN